MEDLRFEAMGTWAHVIVHGGPAGGCHQARLRVEDLERRWSRFRPDSEISRMNEGRPCAVSGETAALLARAGDAARLTGGRFDAGVLAAVVGAGYDRAMGIATLPAACGFDPGGIGKGFAADLVVEELMEAGAAGACVNLGGDLRAEGSPGEAGPPWIVDIEDPFGGPPLVRVGINRGAVATSSRLRRRWAGGHHLIDPASGEPAATDAVAATAVAGTAWRAEAIATAAVVAGVAHGLALFESCGVTGLLVDDHGTVHHGAGLRPFLGDR